MPIPTRTFHALARNGRFYGGTHTEDGWTDHWLPDEDTARLFDLTDADEAREAESAVEVLGGRLFPVECE